MKIATGIRKHGFKKWYERELLRSHAHMALTFLCMVGAIAAFEAASQFRNWTDQLIDFVAIALCGGVGLWALRRYLFILLHAEAIASQADCPVCGSYARFQLVRPGAYDETAQVRCRQCQHEWTIVS